jgi:very-short-patch-repair endonuclease
VLIDERGLRVTPDLVDRSRRLVIEAESWKYHGHRKALHNDCGRYNALVLRGWTVLRFSWEHVMLEPDYVRDVLFALVGEPEGQEALTRSLVWAP